MYTYCENIDNNHGNITFHCHQYSPKTFDLQVAAMKLQTEVGKVSLKYNLLLTKVYLTGEISWQKAVMGYIFEWRFD